MITVNTRYILQTTKFISQYLTLPVPLYVTTPRRLLTILTSSSMVG